ncbi:hypothetical protein EVB81_255 [Rhizobium phage RHph_I46]|uniref:Uncharacterized protein n=1 Tax=Rhizobium phage RHph_I1_9 TaxID=2509729 RepID=A0A7S5RF25_9CAUD|nr:hypothetical protein PP936_gp253 [Rhizobium phage RHph_I1_9]QIG69824.1 hypothetical protein EVB81_255 [Rhizobium phage RHph_I46]QIG71105.1 hypothetical protein EVB92_255 [Rhizobium phage RHph_I9]QIG73690.1 hypothetical protein EVC04_253 [Rhizobium phage RHph_I1_9]QIG76444.1 hypothetical protein EVC25_255 [Rhizobium phage RHph_I34]
MMKLFRWNRKEQRWEFFRYAKFPHFPRVGDQIELRDLEQVLHKFVVEEVIFQELFGYRRPEDDQFEVHIYLSDEI